MSAPFTPLRVLVACEFSGTVRDAFLARGHDAWSCDLLPGGNLKRTKNLPEGFAHNGIDRIDSAKAYRVGNVVPCCGTCNRAKGAMTYAEFIGWACRLADHQRR